MSALAILLHAWRLRRIRWAMSTLDRQLAAYEAAYGRSALRLSAEDLRNAGLARIARS